MAFLPVCMREGFESVQPVVLKVKNPESRVPRPGSDSEATAGVEKSYYDDYVALETIHEDRFILRYPPLASGADSRFHVSTDQTGALWGVLIHRLSEHRETSANHVQAIKKSTKVDGVVQRAARDIGVTSIKSVSAFLADEVKNLKKSRFFSPRAILYSQTKSAAPKKSYFVC